MPGMWGANAGAWVSSSVHCSKGLSEHVDDDHVTTTKHVVAGR